MTPDQIVDDNGAEIVSLVGDMGDQIDQAHTAAEQAIETLYRLTGNGVYDIELIDSPLGDDAEAELKTAARALRNAGRIVAERAALLNGQGGGGGR